MTRRDTHIAYADGLPLGDGGTVITVGMFDGVHLGHQDVLRQLVARADAQGREGVVVTFEPHPLEVVRPAHAPPLLTLLDEKLAMFVQCGVSRVVVLPFTEQLAAFDAATFVDRVLRERYALAELLMGHDHGFGRDRLGDTSVLRALGQERGFGVVVLDPVVLASGDAVSSSVARRAVSTGALGEAREMLGRWYSVSGTVVGGDRRGRLLGYPTLNLSTPSPRKLLPPDGVFAARVQTPSGEFGAMVNLGPRPTFADDERRLEAHLFDAHESLYGARVRVDLVERLRETRAFPSAEALQRQLEADEVAARRILAKVENR